MTQLEMFDVKIDYVFKRLFGCDEEIFIDFTSCILGKKIKFVTFLNNDIDKEFLTDKASRLDVLAEFADGSRINIEMQNQNNGEYKKRSLYYWAKLYEEQLKEGVAYKALKPAIGIHILNFNLSENSLNYHTILEVFERNSKTKFTDDFEIHYLELPKVKKIRYSDLDKWMLFFKNPSLQEVIDMENPVIFKAYEKLKYLSQDPKERAMYEARRKYELDYISAIDHAKEEGLSQGLSQGLSKGLSQGRLEERTEMAKKMFLMDMDLNFIKKITGLSSAEIEKIVR